MLAMAQHINFFAVQVAAQSATFLEFYVHTKQFQMKPRYKDYCSVRWNTTRETCYIQSRPTCSHRLRSLIVTPNRLYVHMCIIMKYMGLIMVSDRSNAQQDVVMISLLRCSLVFQETASFAIINP
ncbi:uncharacterized protein LOC111269247 isoform X1 [Varroa jacobsoni]|uniref:uncharacterized protein LOC111269247 isoform X1 n=1 Tax=Varroa jacobsoni TaxID=62625 RepID=UPI000BF2769D|nr:uncharacterized protein LOC111269247 isoform X1 [Varroa jacobsoni]